MTARLSLAAAILAAGVAATAVPDWAFAQQQGNAAQRPAGLGGLGRNSKEPIKIDADRLDVFDKDKKAVFSGNVVAIQGDTTIKCSVMTVLYEGGATGSAPPAAAPAGGAGGAADNNIRRVECAGPVTVPSKDQVATGDNAVFDRVATLVTLTGNAALSQGQNVTRGERLVDNLNTGVANVEGGRVRALLVPGEERAAGDKPAAGQPAAGQNPAPR